MFLCLNVPLEVLPFTCFVKLCPFATSTCSKLATHARTTHADVFKCSVCPDYFPEWNRLRMHERQHTGVREYKCTVCEFHAVDHFSMRIHLRIHAGKKELDAEVANTSLVVATNWRGKLQNLCSKKFSNLNGVWGSHLVRLGTGCAHKAIDEAFQLTVNFIERRRAGAPVAECDALDRLALAATRAAAFASATAAIAPFVVNDDEADEVTQAACLCASEGPAAVDECQFRDPPDDTAAVEARQLTSVDEINNFILVWDGSGRAAGQKKARDGLCTSVKGTRWHNLPAAQELRTTAMEHRNQTRVQCVNTHSESKSARNEGWFAEESVRGHRTDRKVDSSAKVGLVS